MTRKKSIIHAVNPRTNLPFGDGLYKPFMDIYGDFGDGLLKGFTTLTRFFTIHAFSGVALPTTGPQPFHGHDPHLLRLMAER